ncbi:MAG: PilZ domain-containing protein, partial [Myxococcales bacterium]|nr:PilZ domain-containing protein [Myxococcales bacterium]
MTDQLQNKRRAARLHQEILVAYRSGEGELVSNCCAIDFSSVGLFINATTLLPLGTSLQLIVSLPGGGESFEVVGRVVRAIDEDQGKLTGADQGMGIEFLDVEPVTQ